MYYRILQGPRALIQSTLLSTSVAVVYIKAGDFGGNRLTDLDNELPVTGVRAERMVGRSRLGVWD